MSDRATTNSASESLEVWSSLYKGLKEGTFAVARGSLLMGILFYRAILAPHMGGVCRFSPSCSEYAHQAVCRHHPLRAIYLIGRRLLSCRPGGRFGFDPLPEAGRSASAGSNLTGVEA